MNTKQPALFCAALFGVLAATSHSNAQVPANFPTVTVMTNNPSAVGNGYVFMANNLTSTNTGYYIMALTNDGSAVWYKSLTNAGWDFKVLPNGYLHYAQEFHALTYTGGGDCTHEILDTNYNSVEGIQGGNGYTAEAHDFQMLPNGNVLQFGYYLSQVDMSLVVSNGNPAALVSGAVIQELDAQRTVVFQWRAWDHYPFTSQWVSGTGSVISEFHLNCIFEDTDGNLIISTPDWVKKISRQTGDILWHLGGVENQFTFVGVSQQQGVADFRCHGINRLANGDVLLYNNSAFTPGTTSSVHEFSLDETNKIATLIWTYTPSPNIPGPFQGDAERLSNGDTFVGWGGLGNLTPVACSEIAGTNVVFQMKFNDPGVISYRAYRSPYPPASQANAVGLTDVSAGNSYDFGATGVSLDVATGGGGYNRVTVTREPYAPVYPLFQGKAPRVLPVRVHLNELAVDSMTANVNFDAASFGLANPTAVTVAYRSQTGQGLFVLQPTSHNIATGQLSVAMQLTAQNGDLGEFIFTYPDLPDVAYPPVLAQAESYRGVQPYDVIAPKLDATGETYSVNDQRPVLLSWSPKGLARYFEIELATDSSFSNLIVQVPYQTDAFYVWNGPLADTTYYYRVRTWNDAGASDWSVGSFRGTPAFLTVSAPSAGALWRRGLSYFIQWRDNIPDNVVIDLYKGGSLITNITNNVSGLGAFQWKVPLTLSPGNDYSIKVSSVTNAALSDIGASFSIDAPFIDPSSFVLLPGGESSFTFSAFGSSQATVWTSTNLTQWQDLASVPLSNGIGAFIDNLSSNAPGRFYRVILSGP